MTRIALWKQILIAIVLAVIVGSWAGPNSPLLAWLDPVGRFFMNALKMLIVPLILSSVIVGVASAGGGKDVGRMGGRALAFYVTGRGLLRAGLEPGTPVQTITAEASPGQCAWGPDGTIVFTGGQRDGTRWPGFMRVRSEGGVSEVLTTVDAGEGERLHLWPRFLPDGKTLLFTIECEDHFKVEALVLATGERRTIVDPVDCNVVMNARGQYIEVQGTAEGQSFARATLDNLLNLL